MLKKIDSWLNNHTMYRVVLYGLVGLALLSILFAFLNLLPFSGWQLLSLLLLCAVSSWLAHRFLEKIFHPASGLESGHITGLIFFFILAPISKPIDVPITLAVVFFGAASKYLLAIEKKHLFNPVAIALVVMGLFGYGNAIWWVGSSLLLPFVSLLGLAVLRKLRRFDLFIAFTMASLLMVVWNNRQTSLTILETIWQVLGSWPLVFMGSIMLTEPLTGPVRRRFYWFYGVVVGLFFSSRFQLGPIHSTPELALIIGNLLAYFLTKPVKLELSLQAKRKIGQDLYEFDFIPRGKFQFLAGQYLEWTLKNKVADERGNRRFFTIASAPSEKVLSLAIKVAHPSSSFKQQLMALKEGEKISASQLSGDFVLPKDRQQALVFIAGGIGITPFRSMIKHLIDLQEKREIKLFYICTQKEEFAYQELFRQAENIGLQTIYVLSKKAQIPKDWTGEIGYLNEEMLKKYLGSANNYAFYLSGPNSMVESYAKLLQKMGVKKKKIITDYFPGF